MLRQLLLLKDQTRQLIYRFFSTSIFLWRKCQLPEKLELSEYRLEKDQALFGFSPSFDCFQLQFQFGKCDFGNKAIFRFCFFEFFIQVIKTFHIKNTNVGVE